MGLSNTFYLFFQFGKYDVSTFFSDQTLHIDSINSSSLSTVTYLLNGGNRFGDDLKSLLVTQKILVLNSQFQHDARGQG